MAFSSVGRGMTRCERGHLGCSTSGQRKEIRTMGKWLDKIKGKLMKAEGRATDDPLRQAQGQFHDTKGDVKGAVDRVKDRVDASIHRAERRDRDDINRR
jgi:uncharacterized protein YjbJ (UPF0337 family)